MPLFGGDRDISLFKTMNKELINDIIQTEIGFYKFVIQDSEINVYGESENKVYYEPLLVPALITREDQAWNETDFGPDSTQQMTFAFLRATLVEKNIVPEIGDIVLYNNDYFEFNSIVENQFFTGKNPDYSMNEDTDEFGVSLSIICRASKSRLEQLKTVPVRSGIYPTTTKVEATLANPRNQLYS
tara:strand:- start:1297 stop:1854 length:558 start_codon:yes stop_codon:yes gene_type:complete